MSRPALRLPPLLLASALALLGSCGAPPPGSSPSDPPTRPGAERVLVAPIASAEEPFTSTPRGRNLGQVLAEAVRLDARLQLYPLDQTALLELMGLLYPEGRSGRSLAALCGVDRVLSGSFAERPQRVRLELVLRDAASGEVTATAHGEAPTGRSVELALELLDRLPLGTGPAAPGASRSSSPRTGSELLGRLVPQDPAALSAFAEGRLRLWLSDPQTARTLLEQTVAAAPEAVLPHAFLARALFAVGAVGRAREEAQRALEASSELPGPQRQELEALAALVGGERSVLVAALAAWIDQAPQDPRPRFALVRSLLDQREDAAAGRALGRLQALPLGELERLRAQLLAAELGQRVSGPDRRLELARSVKQRAEESALSLLVAESEASAAAALLSLRSPAESLAAAMEARRIYLEHGHRRQAAQALALAAMSHHLLGDRAATRDAFERVVTEMRREEDPRSLAATLNNLASVELSAGDEERVRRLYEEALEIKRSLSDLPEAARGALRLARLELARGDQRRAGDRLDEAIELARLGGAHRLEGEALRERATLHLRSRRIGAAERDLRHAVELLEGTGEEEATARTALADLLASHGEPRAAVEQYRLATAVWEGTGDPGGASRARLGLASLALETGRPREAETLARQVLEEAIGREAIAEEALSRAILAWALLEQGRATDAQGHMARATEIGSTLEQPELQLSLRLAALRLEAMGGAPDVAGELETIRHQAEERGLEELALEAEIVLAELELGAGQRESGRRRLAEVEQRAKSAALTGIERRVRRTRRALLEQGDE